MDWDIYKDALIRTTEKRAEHYLATGKIEGDFLYSMERFIDNEGYYKVAALILCDAPKGDIRAALEDAMFHQKFIEAECDRLEEIAYEERQRFRNS